MVVLAAPVIAAETVRAAASVTEVAAASVTARVAAAPAAAQGEREAPGEIASATETCRAVAGPTEVAGAMASAAAAATTGQTPVHRVTAGPAAWDLAAVAVEVVVAEVVVEAGASRCLCERTLGARR